MGSVTHDEFIFGIANDDITLALGTGNGFIQMTTEQQKPLLGRLDTQVVGGVRSLFNKDHKHIRQFVGYGLRYCFGEDYTIHYAVYLKTRKDPSTDVVQGVLSLGEGSHLSLKQHAHRVEQGHGLGHAVVCMAEIGISEYGTFTQFDRLFPGLVPPQQTRLGWVIATQPDTDNKTNRHVGIVMAEKIRTNKGDFISKDANKHFVGWFSASGLRNLDTLEGGKSIIYRHQGFEPWAKHIINKIGGINDTLDAIRLATHKLTSNIPG